MSDERIAQLRKLMSAARAKAARRSKRSDQLRWAAYRAEREADDYRRQIENLGGRVRR